LPADVSELVKVIQGLILHIHWAERYGYPPPENRRHEPNLRFVNKQLEQIRSLDASAINIPRLIEKRLLGTCRDFTVFLCSFLRHHNIPTRARCGFGTYFEPDFCADHWICEYWNANEQRWVKVDAQLDQYQCKNLNIEFNPLDIPEGLFLTGGEAWQMCRAKQTDPDKFGIFDMHGMWFIRGNVIRDIASLNKMELLPWDCWGLIADDYEIHSDDDLALLDQTAALATTKDIPLSQIQTIYKENKGLQVTPIISSYIAADNEFQQVDISEDCALIFRRS
jgi:hypothetical protein